MYYNSYNNNHISSKSNRFNQPKNIYEVNKSHDIPDMNSYYDQKFQKSHGNDKNYDYFTNKGPNNLISSTNLNSLQTNTNMNIFGFKKTNNFVKNENPFSIDQQEKSNLNNIKSNYSLKKSARNPTVSNIIQNTSYNIITGIPNIYYNNGYSKNFSSSIMNNKPEYIDNLFYSFKNYLQNNISDNRSILNVNKEDEYIPTNKNENIIKTNPTTKQLETQDSPNSNNLKANNNIYKILSPKLEKDPDDLYVTDASCVKEYSYQQDQNARYKTFMEDTYKAIDKFMRESDKGLFCIYDGHGGDVIAKHAKNRMPEMFEKLYSSNKDKNNDPNYIDNVLITAFHKIDDELKFTYPENVGSTATVLYITLEKDYTSLNNSRKVLYCANVGDSRCVVISTYGAKRLSYDHKASDYNESERIKNSGGVIFMGRVFGQLMLTRALGDYTLKKYGVIATPYINKYFVSERDKYAVIASDGVWDVITDDDMYRLHLTISNSDEYAKLIIKNSIARGSQDNISCLVLKLN